MTEVTSNIFVLFFVMLISYLAKEAKLMPENTTKVLTALLTNITLPALIFSSITGGPSLEILIESLPLICIASAYYIIASLAASLYFKKHKKNALAGVFAYATIFSNTAFIGLPLCSLVYGEPGVVLGSLYDFNQSIFMYTVGLAFLSGREEQGLLDTLKRRLKEPPVLGLFAGLLVLFLKLKIPQIILEPIKMLGSINAVLAMFAIGQYLQLRCFKDINRLKKLFPLVALKLILIPLAVLGIASFLPLKAMSKGVLAIMIGSPTGILTAVFAERYKQDYDFAVMAVVAATGLSVVTLPLILMLI